MEKIVSLQKYILKFMKIRSVLCAFMAFALALCCVSCGNTPKEDNFVGEYSIRMISDSLSSDGLDEWFSAEEYAQMTGSAEEDMLGVMTITEENGAYRAIGSLIDEADTVELFNTTGKLDKDNNLILDNCTTTAETGVVVDFQFRKIAPAVDNVLTFKCQMDMHLGSMLFGYIMTTVAEKK